MRTFFLADFEANRQLWCRKGGLNASTRRQKMATWAAAAWSFVKADAAFLPSAFVSTGFLIRKDGSENHLIKVPGLPDYDFLN